LIAKEVIAMKSGWTIAAIALFLATSAQGELYRWVDENGQVHYSDSPPPSSARKSDRKRLPVRTAAPPALPYGLQQAVKSFPVTLFVSECGDGCTQARQLLAKRGVPHTEMDATDADAQAQLKKATGGRLEVPVLQVGRQTLRGFQSEQWNAALDAAGYPKTALVKVTPTKPEKPPVTAPESQEAQEAQDDEGESDAENAQ
jgi:hypothetical protein